MAKLKSSVLANATLPKGGSGTAKATVRPLSLREIDAEMAVIVNSIIDADGETTPEVDEYYAKLVEMAKKKCDSYLWQIIATEAQVEEAKSIVAGMSKRIARRKALADRLRDNLATFMENNRIEKLIPEDVTLPTAFLNKGKGKIDIDPDRLPNDYVTIKEVREPDKDKIKECIDRGGELPGVTRTTGNPFISLR